jgi:hypothetical protein
MRWTRHAWENEEHGFGQKFSRDRQFGRPQLRWEVDIKMSLREISCKGVDWILLALIKVQ